MSKTLVIVESPAKSKISEISGENEHTSPACSLGFMGVDVENNYKPRYISLKRQRSFVN